MASIRTKLMVVSVSIMTLSMIALNGVNVYASKNSKLEDMSQQTSLLMQSYISEINTWIQTKRKVANGMTAVLTENDLNKISDTAKLLGQATGDYYYMGFPDKAFKNMLTSSKGTIYRSDYDPTSRGWYKKVMEKGTAIVTDPYIGQTQQALVVTIAEPIKDSAGKIVAVVAGDVTMPDIIALIGKLKPTPSSYAFLVSSSGTIITHSLDEKYTLAKLADFTDVITIDDLKNIVETQRYKEVEINGTAGYVYSQMIPMTDWFLVSFVDKKEVTASIFGLIKISVIVAACFILLASLLMVTTIVNITKRLIKIRNAMNNVATGDGDLSRRLEIQGKDEIKEIADGFNTFVNKMARILKDIQKSSESVKISAAEIAAGNMDLSVRTEQQASSLEKTNTKVNELTQTVKSNSEHAINANQLVISAGGVAERGGDTMTKVVSSMVSIKESSQKIVDIINVMNDISFQTNILALNAAVEAARAGEQGRGFAVVASEVRALAQKSSNAAQEIKALIDHAAGEVEEGAHYVEIAGDTMKEIVSNVQNITVIVGEIASASEDQNKSIVGIGETITVLDGMTQQNSALVEQSAAAAESLKDQANKLANMVNIFTLEESSSGKVANEAKIKQA